MRSSLTKYLLFFFLQNVAFDTATALFYFICPFFFSMFYVACKLSLCTNLIVIVFSKTNLATAVILAL